MTRAIDEDRVSLVVSSTRIERSRRQTNEDDGFCESATNPNP